MSNNLQVMNHNGVEVIDSRDVAEMTGKTHAHLMRDIGGYAKIIQESNESNFGLVDFFIPSTYRDNKGETRPCYLLTKKGCDMVANKMTGEKGVLFTAAYVTAFEAMREHITQQQAPMLPQDYISALEALLTSEKQKLQLTQEKQLLEKENKVMKPKADYCDNITKSLNTVVTTQIAKAYGVSAQALNKKLAKYKVQYKTNGGWVLNSTYEGMGLVDMYIHTHEDENGELVSKHCMTWTELGCRFIYEFLKYHNIVPLRERKSNEPWDAHEIEKPEYKFKFVVNN